MNGSGFWPDAPPTRMEHWPMGPGASGRNGNGGRMVRAFRERPTNLGRALDAVVARHGDREAVVDADVRLTHAALHARAAAAARGLAEEGVRPGDRVLLVLDNNWAFVAALLACLRLGAIAVPLNVRSGRAEIAHIAADCGARLTVAEDAAIDGKLLDEADAVRRSRFEEWALVAATAQASDAAAPPGEHDTAVILYTSGTTGRPKGAMLTHANIVHSCLHYAHALELTERDRVALVVPASHVTGLVAIVLASLTMGACILVETRFDAPAFVDMAEGEGMTLTVLVPAMYNLLLLRTDLAAHDLSAWRVGAFGGAPMPVATMERLGAVLPELVLVQAYGSTETTSPATIMPLGRQREALPSVGAPVACADIRVVDEGGREVPRGESGEVWIAGPMVVPGYWNDATRSAEGFAAGYWRSGDVGRFDENGLLHIHDRLKDMINRGGYKVWSAEVENALAFHPLVAEAAVVPRADPVLGEKTHAVVHLDAASAQKALRDEAALVETLRAHCLAHLADYKVPDTFRFSPDPLPRNSNGKLLKRALREADGG